MKMLVHHKEAERALAGTVLVLGDRAMAELVDVVGAEDFFLPGTRAVFGAAKKLWDRRQPIDLVSIEAELRVADELKLVGGLGGLSDLSDHVAAHEYRHHAERVRGLGRVRRLAITCREIIDTAADSLAQPEPWLDDAEVKLQAALQRGDERTAYTGSDVAAIFQGELETRIEGRPIPVVSTGYPDLDHRLGGGMSPGDFVVIAARPSMGKTSFALNIAVRASIWRPAHMILPVQQRPLLQPVLFFSLETKVPKLAKRVHAIEANVKLASINQPVTGKTKNLSGEELQRLMNVGTRLDVSRIMFDDAGGIGISTIRARARRWKADRRRFPVNAMGKPEDPRLLGLIVVDYLQLVKGQPKAVREQVVAEISSGLKALAMELDLPVLSLAQLNRQVDGREDHRPTMSDLRESGQIEQDADVIIFPYRPEVYLPSDAPPDQRARVEGVTEAIIGKARDGDPGTVHMRFFRETQRFEAAG